MITGRSLSIKTRRTRRAAGLLTCRTAPTAAARRGRSGRAPGLTAAPGRRGFTLLELIIVLGLVGVLLGLAAPSLKGFMGTRQTAEAADQILALTELASSQAAALGSPYRLNFDDKTNMYWLTVQQQGQFVDLGTEFGRRFEVPVGGTITLRRPAGVEARSYIEFQPSGRSEEVTIELRGQRGEVYQVVCDSATEAFHVVSPSEADRL